MRWVSVLRWLVLCVQQNANIKWSSRWDYILESMPHTNIQWFRSVHGQLYSSWFKQGIFETSFFLRFSCVCFFLGGGGGGGGYPLEDKQPGGAVLLMAAGARLFVLKKLEKWNQFVPLKQFRNWEESDCHFVCSWHQPCCQMQAFQQLNLLVIVVLLLHGGHNFFLGGGGGVCVFAYVAAFRTRWWSTCSCQAWWP